MNGVLRTWAMPMLAGAVAVFAALAVLVLMGDARGRPSQAASDAGMRSRAVTPAAPHATAPTTAELARQRLDAYSQRAESPLATSLAVSRRTTLLLRRGHGPATLRGLALEQRRATAAARVARRIAPTNDVKLRQSALLLERSLLQQAAMLSDVQRALRAADPRAARAARVQARRASASSHAWLAQVNALARTRQATAAT